MVRQITKTLPKIKVEWYANENKSPKLRRKKKNKDCYSRACVYKRTKEVFIKLRLKMLSLLIVTFEL
jgi:hypothetical protein